MDEARLSDLERSNNATVAEMRHLQAKCSALEIALTTILLQISASNNEWLRHLLDRIQATGRRAMIDGTDTQLALINDQVDEFLATVVGQMPRSQD